MEILLLFSYLWSDIINFILFPSYFQCNFVEEVLSLPDTSSGSYNDLLPWNILVDFYWLSVVGSSFRVLALSIYNKRNKLL